MCTGVIKGYKVFGQDWKCIDNGELVQYSCPGVYEALVDSDKRLRGISFFKYATDCYSSIVNCHDNKIAEVCAKGVVAEDRNVCYTDGISIIRELSWAEFYNIVNVGSMNVGLMNSGDKNTGDSNAGNDNTGSWNVGDSNTGFANIGSWNTGQMNVGRFNTGDRNIGNQNVGDWNKSDGNVGCFMTEGQGKIPMFNKMSDWTYSDWRNSVAYSILSQMPKKQIEWVSVKKMTDKEKKAHLTYEVAGGYLKVVDNSRKVQKWWDGLTEEDKGIVKSLPNFDAEVFKECTGIDVACRML